MDDDVKTAVLVDDLTENKTTGGTLIRFFKHPAVGFVGMLVGIIGVLLSIYFYYETLRSPDLVYYINPARAAVIKQGAASRLTVSDDGQPISTDVTATQVAVWNRGKQAIRQASVLDPIVIRTEPSVPILEATIERRPEKLLS